jgi:hypothetical protein
MTSLSLVDGHIDVCFRHRHGVRPSLTHKSHIILPVTHGFKPKSLLGKAGLVFAAPAVFALTITLPGLVGPYDSLGCHYKKAPNDYFITCGWTRNKHQRVSRTNARVPKHEAIESSKRLLSCLCNDKKASRSVRNSWSETRSSPCTRRNRLRYVWTASKSRRDFKRWERACRKRLKS